MGAADRWRPRVVRTTGSVTEAIYGLILATSVIAVSREYDSSNAGLVGVTVLVTGVVFWLAHVYARVLARSITSHRQLNRSEVRDVLRHDWPLVQVTIPLVRDPRAGSARRRARQCGDSRGDACRPRGTGRCRCVRGSYVGRGSAGDGPVSRRGRGARQRGGPAQGLRALTGRGDVIRDRRLSVSCAQASPAASRCSTYSAMRPSSEPLIAR